MANNSINIAGFFFAGLALVITPLRAAESKITSAEEAKLGQEEIRRERHGIKGGRRESSRDLKNGANNEKLTQDRNEMAPD